MRFETEDSAERRCDLVEPATLQIEPATLQINCIFLSQGRNSSMLSRP